MTTNLHQSTPNPEHDQSQEPIFPDRSCKTCLHRVSIALPSATLTLEFKPYCTMLVAPLATTDVGCSYWEERPTHGH